MRLLHVTDTFLPKIGGAEIAIDQLARAMLAGGVDCGVLAPRPREARGPEIRTPYPLWRFYPPISSQWAGWWIRRHIASIEREVGHFDVLVGHHAFPPGYACVRYALARRTPVIIYPRGGDIYEMSRFRKKPAAWRKLSWALSQCAAIVCASEAMEEVVTQIVGPKAAAGRIVRIPNGVNLQELTADASGAAVAADARLAAPFILGLGRAIKRKGFDLLIDAFAKASPAGWRLVIAGDGRELDALKTRAAPLGDRVVFTGMVEGADKRWLLQNCRFMAAPSLEESFGNVALEAMACGRPVIASRASGFAEIVQDGVNGRLVDVGSIDSLAEALADYTARPLEAQCAAARRTADQFAWDAIAGRWVDLATQVRDSNFVAQCGTS
jgi:glycosyltransferase involved in cell wall biosynthesis